MSKAEKSVLLCNCQPEVTRHRYEYREMRWNQEKNGQVWLNDMGEEGWLVAAITPGGNRALDVYTFVRELPDAI